MSADHSENAGPLILSSQRVFTPGGERAATLRIEGGRIVEIAAYNPAAGNDLGSLTVLPGLIDAHVHLNEPGRTEWEGFFTGTAAAAAGGVTLAVDMPLNSSPVTTTRRALDWKRRSAGDQLSCDVGFYGGIIPGNLAEVRELIDGGVMGMKAFLCDSGIDEFPAASEADLRAAMPILAERGVPLLVHAELVSPTQPMADARSYIEYLATRPASFERRAIEMLIELCRATGCRTHVVHLSDAGSLPMLRDARAEGLRLSVETCPHYLCFASESIPNAACQYKCAPPIRDQANRELLWKALADGTIDYIASDHSPCPPADKRLDVGRFDLAWGGISSIQLTLPTVWTEAQRRGHALTDVIDWLCHRPAAFLGQPAGIEAGAEANLVVFNPDAEFTVVAESLKHRHPITPYDGKTLRGKVVQTYVRGEPARAGIGKAL